MIFLLIGIIVGFILSLIFMAFGFANKMVGSLRIDSSNEDGPYFFLELEKPVSAVISQKYIVAHVDTRNYISQK